MITFLDGPAAGITLALRRAPLYLRAVYYQTGGDGLFSRWDAADHWDALDQLGEVPGLNETVYVYRRVGEAGWAHIDYRDRAGRRKGQTLAYAEYRVIDPQPDPADVRDTARWREWATARAAADRAAAPRADR